MPAKACVSFGSCLLNPFKALKFDVNIHQNLFVRGEE